MTENDGQITIRAPSDIIEKIKKMGKESGRKASGEFRQALIEYVERHCGEESTLSDMSNAELISKILEENREIKKRLEALEALEAEK